VVSCHWITLQYESSQGDSPAVWESLKGITLQYGNFNCITLQIEGSLTGIPCRMGSSQWE